MPVEESIDKRGLAMRTLHPSKANSMVALLAAVFAIAGLTPRAGEAAASEPGPKEREAKLIEAAKKEEKVVYWCPGTAKDIEEVLTRFRQRYPFLKTEYWRAGSIELQQKLLSEARAGVYNPDLMCADIDVIVPIKSAGLIKKYDWPNTKGWRADYRDPEGYWVARHVVVAVIGYNTDLVPPAVAPKNWEDLLQPKWSGEVLMPKEPDWVLQLWAVWGKEKTVKFLNDLAKNKPVLGPGHTARAEMIASGANKVDIRLALHTVLNLQAKKAPIEWVRTNPILAKGTPVSIAQHAPHPNAAVLFADWYTSLEGQKAYQEATGFMMPHPEVRSPTSEGLRGLNVAIMPASMVAYATEVGKIYTELFWK